jgi:hypothetical protein
MKSANPVRYFADIAISQESTESDVIPRSELYEAYKWVCKLKKLAIESEYSFSRKMGTGKGGLGYSSRKVQKDRSREMYFTGIKLVDWVKVKTKPKQGDELQQSVFDEITDFSSDIQEEMR